jgi:hypothetical protein
LTTSCVQGQDHGRDAIQAWDQESGREKNSGDKLAFARLSPEFFSTDVKNGVKNIQLPSIP